jgi:hypothetical protein
MATTNPVKLLAARMAVYLSCLDFIFVLVLETLEDECQVTLGFVNTEIVAFRLSFSYTTIDPEMHSTRPTRRVRSNSWTPLLDQVTDSPEL